MLKHALVVLLLGSTAFASGQPDIETIAAYCPAAIDDGCAPEATIFSLWFKKAFPNQWVTTVGFVAETKPATFGHVLVLFQIEETYYSWDLNFGMQCLGKLTGLPDLAVLTDVAKRRYEVAYTLTVERMRAGIEPVTIGKIPVKQGGEVMSIYARMHGRIPCLVLRYKGRVLVAYLVGDVINVFCPGIGNQSGRLKQPKVVAQAVGIILAKLLGGDGKFAALAGSLDAADPQTATRVQTAT